MEIMRILGGGGNLSHLIIHESLSKRALGRVRLVPRALESRVQGVWKQEGYGFRDLKRQNGSGIEPLLGICQEEARSWGESGTIPFWGGSQDQGLWLLSLGEKFLNGKR